MSGYSPAEIQQLLPYLTPEEREYVEDILRNDRAIWRPLPGPQADAYWCDADVLGYGGAAGGGKTDLGIGKALTRHQVIAIFRREGTELTAIEDRIREIVGSDRGYNGQKRIWRQPVPRVKQIEFGSVPNAGDETKYQGRPKDLLHLDEAANMLEQQVRFLMGWVRTTDPRQLTQTLLTFNPPTSVEGRWVVQFFAPWLDRNYAGARAKPGELRYFAMIGRDEVEVPDARPFILLGDERVYEFDRIGLDPTQIIVPKSRTFIPSRISDNPYLYNTGYMATLQALPEPLRSQMLYGDFEAGMQDDPWQVIPTEWVDIAMRRWRPRDRKPPMAGTGTDVARGGGDNTIIARRHEDWWFDEPLVYPGKQTPDGPTTASLVIAATRDRAPAHIDIVGVGASPYDFLVQAGIQVVGINGAAKTTEKDKSGMLDFANLRSYLWWHARELLDPEANNGIALPPSPELRRDLTTPKWSLHGRTIYVQSREDVLEELGRSYDWGAAYVMAMLETPRREDVPGMTRNRGPRGHDPYTYMKIR